MPGVPCPLVGRKPGDIDFYVVRENTEGEYSNVGGRMFADTEREFVVQETYMTRIGVDRVVRFAFELARTRPRKHLTSATKSNGISITMPYWDERVEAVAKSFPDVRWGKFPSVFEPVHGAAPDIAGQGIANPIGQIWSGAMMLDHLGEKDAGRAIVDAIERVLGEKTLRTRDLGGNADTATCGKAVAEAID